MSPELRRSVNGSHVRATQAWNERSRVKHLEQEGALFVAAEEPEKRFPTPVQHATVVHTGISGADILFARVLLDTRGSFRDYGAWASAARAVCGSALMIRGGRGDCKRALDTVGYFERQVSRRLLAAGISFRLQSDGLARTLQVVDGTVIREFPMDFPGF